MKMKKIVLMLVLCALSFSIFGCSLFQKDILDGEMLAEFLEKEEQVSKTSEKALGAPNITYVSNEERVSIENGFVIIYNSTKREHRFLSLATGAQIANYYEASTNGYDFIGECLVIYDGMYVKVFDCYGNQLFNQLGTRDQYNFACYMVEQDDKDVLKFVVDDIEKLYEYSVNNTLVEVVFEDDKLTIGNVVNKLEDLKEDYGIDAYWIRNGNTCIIYDENKEYNFTFTLPDNHKKWYIIGNKLYYYIRNELPEDAEKYDMFMDDSKYSYEVHSINLLNGKEKEEDLDYLIVDADHLDSTDKNNYTVVTIKKINKDKTLSCEEVWIADKKGDLKQNITDFAPNGYTSFFKVDNNFVNKEPGILYNNELEVIASLGHVDEIIDNYMVVEYNDKKGIVNSEGVLVAAFEYDDFEGLSNGYAIGYKDSKYYRIDLNSQYVTQVENMRTTSIPNLFVIETDETIQYVSTNGTVFATYYKNSYYGSPIEYSYYYNKYTKTYYYYILSKNLNTGHVEKLTVITYK